MRNSIAIVVTAALVLLTGCRAGYVFHAGLGQFRMLRDSIPLEKALQDASLGDEERGRLRLVPLVREFGVEDLGLERTSSYRTVYLKNDRPPIYLLAASPRDRLERITWWFPVIGEVPYLGFFDRRKAARETAKLSERGLDVYLGTADAYSTLGWFSDPVTLNLIEGSTADLVETILHEMTHATLYVPGQSEFNEGLAVLVGSRGALRFFETRYGAHHPHTREAAARIRDERMFSEFLDGLMERLETVYGSPEDTAWKMARREQCFREAEEAFDRLRFRFRTRRYAGASGRFRNNAYLMTVGLYHRHFRLFEAVLEAHGGSIGETIAFFRRYSGEADLLETARLFLIDQQATGPRPGAPPERRRADFTGLGVPEKR